MGDHRTTRLFGAALLAVALVATAVLGGCGGDDDDDGASSTTVADATGDDGGSGDAGDSGDDPTTRDDEAGSDGTDTAEPGDADDEPNPDGAADDPTDADEPGDPDDGGATETTVVAPALPLAPSDPAWADACDAATLVVTDAYALISGGEVDPASVGASLLALLDALPAGVATEEAAYVRQLVQAYAADDDLASFEDDFRTHVDGLMAAVAEGCGIDGASAAIPPAALDQLEDLLFG